MSSCLAIANRKSKCQFEAQVILEQLCSVPFVNGTLFAKLRLLHGRHQCKYSERIAIQDHTVEWHSSHLFTLKLGRNADLSLESCYLKVSIRQEVKGGKGSMKLGFVTVNLSCFADKGRKEPIRRRYLLQAYDQKQRQNNALLYLNFTVCSRAGPTDHIWRLPEESLTNQVPLNPDCNEPPPPTNDLHLPLTSSALPGSLLPNSRISHQDPFIPAYGPPTSATVSSSLFTTGPQPPPLPPASSSSLSPSAGFHQNSTSRNGFSRLGAASASSPPPLQQQQQPLDIICVPSKSSHSGTSENSQAFRSAGSTSDSNNVLTDDGLDDDAPEAQLDDYSQAPFPRKNSNDSWKSFSDEHIGASSSTTYKAAASAGGTVSGDGIGRISDSPTSQYSQGTIPPLAGVFSVSGFSPEGGYYSASTMEELSCETTSDAHRRHPSSLSGISLLMWPPVTTTTTGNNLSTTTTVPLPISQQQQQQQPAPLPPLAYSSSSSSGHILITKQHSRQASLDSGCHPHVHNKPGCIFDPSIERVKDKRTGEKQSLIDSSRANNDQVVSEILRLSLNSSSAGGKTKQGHNNNPSSWPGGGGGAGPLHY